MVQMYLARSKQVPRETPEAESSDEESDDETEEGNGNDSDKINGERRDEIEGSETVSTAMQRIAEAFRSRIGNSQNKLAPPASRTEDGESASSTSRDRAVLKSSKSEYSQMYIGRESDKVPSLETCTRVAQRKSISIHSSNVDIKAAHLEDMMADVERHLQIVQQWSTLNGDNTLLESIHAEVDDILTDLDRGHERPAGQYQQCEQTTGGTFHNDLPSSSQTSFTGSGKSVAGRNESFSQYSPTLKVTDRSTDTSPKRLRCPFFFHDQEEPCGTLHKYIRDLTRHLRRHRLYFCSKCCQHFRTDEQMRNHSCEDRVCVDVGCPKRVGEIYTHPWQSGCKLSFDELGTREKWFALDMVQFPDCDRPQWEDVLVILFPTTPSTSPHDSVREQMMTDSSPITRVSSSEEEQTAARALSVAEAPQTGQDDPGSSEAVSRLNAEMSAAAISQQMRNLRDWYFQHSSTIMNLSDLIEEQEERLRHQHEQIQRQREHSRQQQEQIRALQNAVLEVRGYSRIPSIHDSRYDAHTAAEELMQVDL